MKSLGKGKVNIYNAPALAGNGKAAGVNHRDPQVLEVEQANYLAKTSSFGKKKKIHINKTLGRPRRDDARVSFLWSGLWGAVCALLF